MIIPVDSDSWHIFSKCLKKFKAHHYEFQTPWVLRVNFLQNNLQNYSSLIKHFRKKYLNVATKMASAVENVEPQNFTKPSPLTYLIRHGQRRHFQISYNKTFKEHKLTVAVTIFSVGIPFSV
jgi:hypothetical protein